MTLQNLHQRYRRLSLALVATVLANLILPAAFGGAVLFCLQVPQEHSLGMHAAAWCCAHGEADVQDARLASTSCTMDRFCDEVPANRLAELPLIQSHSQRAADVLYIADTPIDPIRQHVSHLISLVATDFTAVIDIHIMISTFLN